MLKDSKGIAERFAIILSELSSRDKININDLEEITGYDKRNLQMDLNQRLKLPFRIETDRKGNYWMDKKYRGLFSVSDIKEFSKILGIAEIFPDLDNEFLVDIINNKVSRAYIIKSPYKDSLKENSEFYPIIKAINRSQKLKFSYSSNHSNKKRYLVEPYRLVNNYGTWYLFAIDNKKLKSFKLSKITGALESFDSFIIDNSIVQEIENSKTIWLSTGDKISIKLMIIPSFADYFKESITLPGEQKYEEKEDGSLLVTVKVSSYEQIKNVIKYWIPNIKILEPQELKDILNRELLEYSKL